MPYIRISIARPRPGEEHRFEEVEAQIVDFISKQPGCEQSYLLRPHDESGELARITLWDSEESAENAAKTDTLMALRSELNRLCVAGSHTERAFSDRPHTNGG